MKMLGVDYGKKKIGIAYSEGLLAEPFSTIQVKTKKQVLTEISTICEKFEIEKIVIGLSGGPLDKETRAFGDQITKYAHITVDFVDETLTSREAVKKMVEGKTSRKKRRLMEDAVAATIILNTYLESQEK